MKLKSNDIPKFKNMTEEEKKKWEEKLHSNDGYHVKGHMTQSINQIKGWIF